MPPKKWKRKPPKSLRFFAILTRNVLKTQCFLLGLHLFCNRNQGFCTAVFILRSKTHAFCIAVSQKHHETQCFWRALCGKHHKTQCFWHVFFQKNSRCATLPHESHKNLCSSASVAPQSIRIRKNYMFFTVFPALLFQKPHFLQCFCNSAMSGSLSLSLSLSLFSQPTVVWPCGEQSRLLLAVVYVVVVEK